MNLTQLANLGEFIGGIAVLATLLYLVKQIRLSNRLVRSQVHQDASQRSSDLLLALTEPDELGLGSWMGETYARLPEGDKFRASLRFLAFVNYYETLFYAHERGDVDEDLWVSRVARMRWTFTELNRELWEERKEGFGERFRVFVETEILAR